MADGEFVGTRQLPVLLLAYPAPISSPHTPHRQSRSSRSSRLAVVSATVTYNNITAAASAAAAAAAASTSYAAVRGYKGERPTAMLPLISIR